MVSVLMRPLHTTIRPVRQGPPGEATQAALDAAIAGTAQNPTDVSSLPAARSPSFPFPPADTLLTTLRR
jgi:hypothetical protein